MDLNSVTNYKEKKYAKSIILRPSESDSVKNSGQFRSG